MGEFAGAELDNPPPHSSSTCSRLSIAPRFVGVAIAFDRTPSWPSGRPKRSTSFDYADNPAAWSASPSGAASTDAQFTPANWRLLRKPGCNSKTRSRRPGIFDAAKLYERCGQLDAGDTMGRVRLDRPVRGAAGFLVAAQNEVAHCLRIECRKGPRIEWTEPHATLTPSDGLRRLAGPAQDHRAQDVGNR